MTIKLLEQQYLHFNYTGKPLKVNKILDYTSQ